MTEKHEKRYIVQIVNYKIKFIFYNFHEGESYQKIVKIDSEELTTPANWMNLYPQGNS